MPHAMQFPAELTQNACRTRPRELRLICIYFFTDYFFQVSATQGPSRVGAGPFLRALQASVPLPGLCTGTSTRWDQPIVQPEPAAVLSGPWF